MLSRRIRTASGEAPADLWLVNGLVLNVFTQEWEEADLSIKDGYIAGVYPRNRELPPNHPQRARAIRWELTGLAGKVVDLDGAYVLPGLIDAHVHIESSLMAPPAFAKAVVPLGTTTVVADPHEIVNVMGKEGFRAMIGLSKGLPLDILYMVPSCVPATHLETSGASLNVHDIGELLEQYSGSGLAEMMNFPGVVSGDPDVLAKLEIAKRMGRVVDGHAPGLSGALLCAYVTAGVNTDHECTTSAEAMEKLSRGMHILIREGTAAQNLNELISIVSDHTWHKVSFCSDDRHAEDLLLQGHMDYILRKAISLGLEPIRAITLASYTAAQLYGLKDRGAIAPGLLGDMLIVNNLHDLRAMQVYKAGKLVAAEGIPKGDWTENDFRNFSASPIMLPPLEGRLTFELPEKCKVKAIKIVPDQIITEELIVKRGDAVIEQDVLPIAVIERHGRRGTVGCGLVKGFGLKSGALAATVAHDSHNLIVVGASQSEMALAAQTVAKQGGGMAVVHGNEVRALLPLPFGGLMSCEEAPELASKLQQLNNEAKTLGCLLPSPFMTMSFLALPVIPALKITDLGLVDVERFSLTAPILESEGGLL